MSRKLNDIQIAVLIAYSFRNITDHKTSKQLVSEYGSHYIYDVCIELQKKQYFSNNIIFRMTIDGNLSSVVIGDTDPLTQRGIEAIQDYL